MALMIYKSYVFRNKDPEIDVMRTLVQDHFGGRLSGKQFSQIEEDGGPTSATMRNWFFGTTKRPQNATLEAAGRAMGFRRKWVKLNGAAKKKK